jgi:TRAP-type transport system periplasmic protein
LTVRWGTLGVFTALRYYDAAKYMNETGHAFAFSLAVVSKKWFDALPDDLKTMLLSTAAEIGPEINIWQIDFIARQRKIWVENGGKLDALSPAEKAEMMAKIGTVGDEMISSRPNQGSSRSGACYVRQLSAIYRLPTGARSKN